MYKKLKYLKKIVGNEAYKAARAASDLVLWHDCSVEDAAKGRGVSVALVAKLVGIYESDEYAEYEMNRDDGSVL